ncbi:MAG: adenylate/guanylate cyclase domain-containing protein, partial [Pseudomonadota bacterium]|nr:adenylate/guanylate cyclase domain-containing protein [Pseudomonadota bacterium]
MASFRQLIVSNWALAGLVVLVLAAVRTSDVYTDFAARGFDVLSTLAQPVPESTDIVLVAIDEPSMAEFGMQFPWPRAIHADLIEALRGAGVKAIGMDVLFAEPSDPDNDAALAAVAGPDIVFAATEVLAQENYGEVLLRTEPVPELLETGAQSGLISVPLDGDGVLRSVPAYEDGFARKLLEISGAMAAPQPEQGQRIQYLGPEGSYPKVSYYQALEPETYLPPGYLEGAVVIVGYNLQAIPQVGSAADDAFESPYTLSTRQLMPGPEVHATIFDNLRHGLTINRPARWLGWALLLMGAIAGLLSSRPDALWKRAVLASGLLIGAVIASWITLRFGRYWASPLDPLLACACTTLAIGVRDFASEQRRRREVQGAFAQYISPVMVERLVADPSLLKLGGERKELTVMFSDIRGFTTISEAMKNRPEDLVHVINDILTPVSEIVIRHGGTIDKYMGDCIMAFWNAPLDNPDHAQDALNAASEMLEIMPDVNRRIARFLPDGAPDVRIGIGINTGECVVGNMGSDQR